MAKKNNNKFTRALNQGSLAIKSQRANNLYSITERAGRKNIDALQEECDKLESKIISLTDIYPDSELTTLVVSSDFNPDEWFSELLQLSVDKEVIERELAIAKTLYDEWFGNSSEDSEGDSNI